MELDETLPGEDQTIIVRNEAGETLFETGIPDPGS